MTDLENANAWVRALMRANYGSTLSEPVNSAANAIARSDCVAR